ncbi:hypothetical protein BV494_06630 [Rahnella sikkimica]|uniref:Uncharacterized protein n=1 Tax=Rahnella sikkimica TaxID=1805933 RepID=A0A2L1UNX4_9GAMM|nr:hypothetical protein BV494_06630 [Rahnella sikkimica]
MDDLCIRVGSGWQDAGTHFCSKPGLAAQTGPEAMSFGRLGFLLLPLGKGKAGMGFEMATLKVSCLLNPLPASPFAGGGAQQPLAKAC